MISPSTLSKALTPLNASTSLENLETVKFFAPVMTGGIDSSNTMTLNVSSVLLPELSETIIVTTYVPTSLKSTFDESTIMDDVSSPSTSSVAEIPLFKSGNGSFNTYSISFKPLNTGAVVSPEHAAKITMNMREMISPNRFNI